MWRRLLWPVVRLSLAAVCMCWRVVLCLYGWPIVCCVCVFSSRARSGGLTTTRPLSRKCPLCISFLPPPYKLLLSTILRRLLCVGRGRGAGPATEREGEARSHGHRCGVLFRERGRRACWALREEGRGGEARRRRALVRAQPLPAPPPRPDARGGSASDFAPDRVPQVWGIGVSSAFCFGVGAMSVPHGRAASCAAVSGLTFGR